MQAASRRAVRFVQLLLAGAEGSCLSGGGLFRVAVGERVATLEAVEVRGLISSGVLSGDGDTCRASRQTRNWLRRELTETDGFAAQHRHEVRRADGALLNLSESPLARLAVPAAGDAEPFLLPHQVEAGERVRKLIERAHLQQRVTMSYSATHTAGRKAAGTATEITDLAADARVQVAEISRVLPRDCAGVVLDVCGFLKGLQLVETERGWPRRSAKLVLRIGLEQLAVHYGLSPHAVGAPARRNRTWLSDGARPDVFE